MLGSPVWNENFPCDACDGFETFYSWAFRPFGTAAAGGIASICVGAICLWISLWLAVNIDFTLRRLATASLGQPMPFQLPQEDSSDTPSASCSPVIHTYPRMDEEWSRVPLYKLNIVYIFSILDALKQTSQHFFLVTAIVSVRSTSFKRTKPLQQRVTIREMEKTYTDSIMGSCSNLRQETVD